MKRKIVMKLEGSKRKLIGKVSVEKKNIFKEPPSEIERYALDSIIEIMNYLIGKEINNG